MLHATTISHRCDTLNDDIAKISAECRKIHDAALLAAQGLLEKDEPSELSEPGEVDTTSMLFLPPDGKHVVVRYGPYDSCGIVEHRLHRLHGLKEMLIKAGNTVEMQTIPDWNVVELWVNGQQIFNCDVRDLDFGGDGQLDELCIEAVDRVKNAF